MEERLKQRVHVAGCALILETDSPGLGPRVIARGAGVLLNRDVHLDRQRPFGADVAAVRPKKLMVRQELLEPPAGRGGLGRFSGRLARLLNPAVPYQSVPWEMSP